MDVRIPLQIFDIYLEILQNIIFYLLTSRTVFLVKENENHEGPFDLSLKVPRGQDHDVLVVHVRGPDLGVVPGVHRGELQLHIMFEFRSPGNVILGCKALILNGISFY